MSEPNSGAGVTGLPRAPLPGRDTCEIRVCVFVTPRAEQTEAGRGKAMAQVSHCSSVVTVRQKARPLGLSPELCALCQVQHAELAVPLLTKRLKIILDTLRIEGSYPDIIKGHM